MITIYKYLINIKEEFDLLLPRGAKILDIQYQGSNLYLWALVNTANAGNYFKFKVYGTGQSIDSTIYEDLCFVKTIQQGPFVWHIFRVIE